MSEEAEGSARGKYECSIVIPVYNCAELTRQCLDAIRKNTSSDIDYEVVVVDNGSTDRTGELLACIEPPFRFIRNAENLGFARGCNAGAQAARGEFVLFLNNDTVPLPGWLPAMLDCMRRHPDAGIVGSKLVFPQYDLIQHAGVAFSKDGLPFPIYRMLPADIPEANVEREYDAVTAACLLVRRSLFAELNGFDPAFNNGYEDVDFCLRARESGLKVFYCPSSVLYHYESMTPGRHDRDAENLERLRSRWADRITEYRYDPFAALARVGDPLLKADGVTGTRFVLFAGRTFIKCDREPFKVRTYGSSALCAVAVAYSRIRYFMHRASVRKIAGSYGKSTLLVAPPHTPGGSHPGLSRGWSEAGRRCGRGGGESGADSVDR